MIVDLNKILINKADFTIPKHIWMIEDKKNCKCYYDTLKYTPEYLRILLDEFEDVINPFSKGILDENILKNTRDVKLYQEKNHKNCAHFTINDDKCIRKYLRRDEGFAYTFTGKPKNNIKIYLCHYFKGIGNSDGGEGISIILPSGHNIKYNLTKQEFEINQLRNMDIEKVLYLICKILEDIIRTIKPNSLEKVEIFKKTC